MPTITTIAPGHWLDTAPAASYARMRAVGCPAGITDAGRTDAEQVALFTDRYTTNYAASTKFDRRVWQGRTYWRKPGCDSAATPGTSKHETGRAVDLPAAAAAWVRDHGGVYGWIAGLVVGEWWHMEYIASRDTHLTPAPTAQPVTSTTAGSSPTTPPEVIDMRQAIIDIFEHYTGFVPSEGQVQEFTAFWMLNGPEVTARNVRDSAVGQVAQAYRDELGRNPESPAIVAAYLAQFHGDIAAIRAALAASPEGRAH